MTVTMVADLTSVRAALVVQNMAVCGTPLVSLDLYAELMLEAVHQVAPGAQLQHVTAFSLTPQDQLVVKMTGADIVITHGASGEESHRLCAQAMVAHPAISAQTAVVPHVHSRAVISAFMTHHEILSEAVPAAAIASLFSICNTDEGYRLPGAVITAAAQLQTSVLSAEPAAALPTALACVESHSTRSAELVMLTSCMSTETKLNAAAANTDCSGVAIHLKGISMSATQKALSMTAADPQRESQHADLPMPMLYQLEWKAAAAELQTVKRIPGSTLRQYEDQVDHAQVCTKLMAAAQQSLNNKSHRLHLQLSQGHLPGPNDAMALALLRSVAQEAASVTCTASAAAAHGTVTSGMLVSPLMLQPQAVPVTRLQRGIVQLPRLVPAKQQQQHTFDSAAATDSCIILGGTGSIGSLAATAMANRGTPEVILVGRTGKLSLASSSNFCTLLAKQSTDGDATMVTIARCDTACKEESSWLYKHARGAKKLILHAGGVSADATIAKQSLSGIRQVFAAKVHAAQHACANTAHEATAGMVLFSSVAALLGSAGQGNYSAANGALDGLAGMWELQGRSVTAMQWGPWAGKLIPPFKSATCPCMSAGSCCCKHRQSVLTWSVTWLFVLRLF